MNKTPNLQQCAERLKDLRLIEQFSKEHGMVRKKHILSEEVISFIQLHHDLETISKYQDSVLKESLIRELHQVLNSEYPSVFDTIEKAYRNEQSHLKEIARLKDELASTKDQLKASNARVTEVRQKDASEENEVLHFIYEDRLAYFLWKRWLKRNIVQAV